MQGEIFSVSFSAFDQLSESILRDLVTVFYRLRDSDSLLFYFGLRCRSLCNTFFFHFIGGHDSWCYRFYRFILRLSNTQLLTNTYFVPFQLIPIFYLLDRNTVLFSNGEHGLFCSDNM